MPNTLKVHFSTPRSLVSFCFPWVAHLKNTVLQHIRVAAWHNRGSQRTCPPQLLHHRFPENNVWARLQTHTKARMTVTKQPQRLKTIPHEGGLWVGTEGHRRHAEPHSPLTDATSDVEQPPPRAQTYRTSEMALQTDRRSKQYLGRPFLSSLKWLFSKLFGTPLSCWVTGLEFFVCLL